MALCFYLFIFMQQSLEDMLSRSCLIFVGRLMEAVEFAVNLLQRWARILITMKNVESAGELTRKKNATFHLSKCVLIALIGVNQRFCHINEAKVSFCVEWTRKPLSHVVLNKRKCACRLNSNKVYCNPLPLSGFVQVMENLESHGIL